MAKRKQSSVQPSQRKEALEAIKALRESMEAIQEAIVMLARKLDQHEEYHASKETHLY